MKVRYWITIIVGVIVLALIAGFALLRGGDRPWQSKASANSKDLVRIATFNVGELFDPDDDPGLSGEYDDAPSPQPHLDAIASAIIEVDADILALERVESLEAVEWFNQTYLSSLGYEHIASLDVEHKRGIENAVLSRFPITESMVWPGVPIGGEHPSTAGGSRNSRAGQPIAFNRSPLLVTVDIPGGPPLSLFVVELKGGDKYDYWREAENYAIIELCKQIGMNRRIVVLGSFHCDPDAPSLQPYLDAGFRDPFAGSKKSEYHATEISGDRTDFIFANRSVGRDLSPDTGFVLGGDFAEGIRSGEVKTTHLPVVIGLRTNLD